MQVMWVLQAVMWVFQEKRKATELIGKHFGDKHSLAPRDLTKNFLLLEKCTKKLDCLLYEMFLFKN